MTKQILTDKESRAFTSKIEEFLTTFYGAPVSEFVPLSGGKHSYAFSYVDDSKPYVIRLNTTDAGFIKDEFAALHFGSNAIPVPKIVHLGVFDENYQYCISEKVPGATVRAGYNRKEYDSLTTQFEMIERISAIPIPDTFTGIGRWETTGAIPTKSLAEHVAQLDSKLYESNHETLVQIPYFDSKFVDVVRKKLASTIQYSEGIREIVHADFGNENVFMADGEIVGIIDWEQSLVADRFIDVGRVVLFCPNRTATVQAAQEFYKNCGVTSYKERIRFGVYYAMLKNYAAAALSGNEASCRNSSERIEEFERLIG